MLKFLILSLSCIGGRSAQYIDYEKLKEVLKRAKKCADIRDETLKRMSPAVRVEVEQQLKDREVGSAPDLTRKNSGTSDVVPISSSASVEASPLLGGWSSMFSVTSYLGLADDRAMYLKAYDDADDKLKAFVRSYEQEVKKVQDFYIEKTDEISQRMEVLKESVATSGIKPTEKQQHRLTLVQTLTEKFDAILHKTNMHETNGDSEIPALGEIFSESVDVDDDEGYDKKEKKDAIMRKSDSIKRAITDVYRTSKLLQNYSIMVSFFFFYWILCSPEFLFFLTSLLELHWIC